jgi:hypothetical protein
MTDWEKARMDEPISAYSSACELHTAWLTAQQYQDAACGYDMSLDGLRMYLEDHGIENFSAREIATPARPDLWLELYPDTKTDPNTGELIALPSQGYWSRWMAPLTIIQELRDLVSEPILIRHVWRPSEYNRAVGGSSGSDHLQCCAIDFDVMSGRALEICRLRLGELYASNRLGLSVGWHSSGDGRRFHLGVLALRTIQLGRQRNWDYGGKHDSLSAYVRRGHWDR